MLDLTCFKVVFPRSNTDRKLWITIGVIVLQLVSPILVGAQCKDTSLCSFMASEGECENDPDTMLQDCPKACKNPCLCTGISQDTACDCLVKAKNGYCHQPGALTDCQSTCTQVTHETCPLLPMPGDPNARLSTWSTNYLTTVTEVCVPGYAPLEPDNQGKKTCSSGQRWVDDPYNGTPVECTPIDCGPPPTAPNSFSVPSDTTFGAQTDYSCAKGYSHVQGQKTLTCNASALWEGELIVCRKMDCGSPPPSANASFKVVNASSGQTATYTCSVGFRRSQGETILRCSSTGVWQGTLIVCTAIDCGPPPSPSNVEVTVKDTTYGKTANLTCMHGYTRVQGHDVIICNNSGAWDPEPPVCAKVNCGQPPSAPNTDLAVNNTSYGDTANYTCTRGYAYDDGDMTLTCGSQGSWEGVLMSCTRVSCGKPPNATNARANTTGTLYGDAAAYSCLPGYAYVRGDKILQCDASGSWVGVPISCQILDCGTLPAPAHAVVHQPGTWFGQSAIFSCQLGYTAVSGSTTRVCTASGQWSGTPLVCAVIDCGGPPSLPHTDVQVSGTTYNQTANYSCQIGYQIQQGQSSLICGLSGKWTGNSLKCQIVNCGRPPKGANLVMSYTSTTFGQKVTYSCSARYKYSSGDRNLTCSQTGNWTGQLMKCVEKDCGVPEVYNSSDVRFTSTTAGSQAIYTCSAGSQRVGGDPKRICQEDETWSGLPVTCDPSGSQSVPTSAHKKTLEAPVAWAIGVAIFAVLATVTVLCIVMDCGALRKNFRKDVTNSTSKIRLTTKWKPGSSKEARLVPSSSSGIPSVSSSSVSMSSGANYFHGGESLTKSNNLHPTHQTLSNSQSLLFPPSVSPQTPRTSLSIPNSPSGITLSSLSETTLRNPMPDVGT